MHFENYQSQINELISLRSEPDFNDIVENILFGESTSNKFLIKMEINRLSKPCQRIIDFRGKVNSDCQLFEQEHIKHYLAHTEINVFKENIKLYGCYTVGVFEAVQQHFNQQKKTNKPPPPFLLLETKINVSYCI